MFRLANYFKFFLKACKALCLNSLKFFRRQAPAKTQSADKDVARTHACFA
jgi:hypothetical protein